MYAVIRAGGKQYRVAPGDVIRVEKAAGADGKVEFNDVLAVSGQEGHVGRPQSSASVVGSVVEEGRADKILVFHYKRKKQYKKLRGHRQAFTAVRITEIAFDGQRFTAPAEAPKPEKPRRPQPPAAPAAEAAGAAPAPTRGAKGRAAKAKAQAKAHAQVKAHAKPAAHAAPKKAAPKKAAHKPAAKKGGSKGKGKKK